MSCCLGQQVWSPPLVNVAQLTLALTAQTRPVWGRGRKSWVLCPTLSPFSLAPHIHPEFAQLFLWVVTSMASHSCCEASLRACAGGVLTTGGAVGREPSCRRNFMNSALWSYPLAAIGPWTESRVTARLPWSLLVFASSQERAQRAAVVSGESERED